VAALASALSFIPLRSHAGGFANPEMGERRTGMAAVVGRPDDLSAVFHNPAGLTLRPGTHIYLSLGVVFMDTTLRLRPWPESDRFITDPVDGDGYYPEVSPDHSVAPIPMFVASTSLFYDKLVGAVSFYVPNAGGAFFDEDSVARYHLFESYLVAGVGGLSLAFEPLPWLSVGAGFSFVFVKFYAHRKLFPVLKGIDLSGFLGSGSDLELWGDDVVPGWNIGLLLWPHRTLSIGASFISRSDLEIEGDVELAFGDDSLKPDLKMSGRHTTGMLLPWTLLVGINWDAWRFVEVGAELRYYFLRQFENQHTDITGIDVITEYDSPKDFSDSWQVAAGVRVHSFVDRLELMAGWHYDRSPAPSHTVSIESPFFHHTALYCGVRYEIGRYRLALTYAHYWYLQRRTEDSVTDPPVNFVGSAQNNILSLTFDVSLGKGLFVR
jgi:long-subunit fatty acid transport protein